MSSAFEGLPKTPNLSLNKPGYDNVADIEALNENADILDEEISTIKSNLKNKGSATEPIYFDGNGVPQKTKNFNDYLPLAGGLMTDTVIGRSVNNSQLVFRGGTNADGGAALMVCGKDYNNGRFLVRANNGSAKNDLIGTADGTLMWNNKNIVRSVNGNTADSNGNVEIDSGIPVGFEYFSTNPNIPAGSIPLFGGEYSRTVYKDLWEWVQTQAGYLLTEEEWQAKASANDGNVPYYSSGDGSTTFRVPSLKCWVKGSNGIEEVGSYLSAGLPNITGSIQYGGVTGLFNVKDDAVGAFKAEDDDKKSSRLSSNSGTSYGAKFNASYCSSIYGNSTTVQPKSIVGMWLVKAYGTVTNVGSTDVSAIAVGLTELETRCDAHIRVVETYNDGTNWYRKWSDGWLEQGGCFAGRFTNFTTITYPLPFSQVYTVLKTNRVTTSYNQALAYDWFAVVDATNTNFKSTSAQDVGIYWYACGMGA